MNPLAITAAPVQGGVSEFTAPCAFDPIYTFLSYNYTYNSFFLMARDGVTIFNINKHLFPPASKTVTTPGRPPSSAVCSSSPPGGPM